MITCKFENGNDAELRHAVVGAIVLNDKEQILLGKRAPQLREGGKYNLMAGFMSRDESVEDAVRREVREESGYNINIDYFFYVNDITDVPGTDWQNVAFMFVAHIKDKVSEPDNESTDLQWFDLDKLPPKEEVAFDHYERIQLYLKHLKEPFTLPFFRSKVSTT